MKLLVCCNRMNAGVILMWAQKYALSSPTCIVLAKADCIRCMGAVQRYPSDMFAKSHNW
jgi:hypothetical protein